MKNMASLSLESAVFTLLFPLILRNAAAAKMENPVQRTDCVLVSYAEHAQILQV